MKKILSQIKGFSLKVRPKLSCLLVGVDPNIPEVGKYNPKLEINPIGNYPLAKYKNTKKITFGARTDELMYKRLCKSALLS